MSKDLDEKVANLHFLTLFSRRAGVRDDSASARWLRQEPFDGRSARMS